MSYQEDVCSLWGVNVTHRLQQLRVVRLNWLIIFASLTPIDYVFVDIRISVDILLFTF